MVIKEVRQQDIETIESEGAIDKIKGISQAKSFRGWLQGRLQVYRNRNNLELSKAFEGIIQVYNHYHPELKETIELASWKGKSGLEIREYPTFFECIEWRKMDKEGEATLVKNRVTKEEFNGFLKALDKLEPNIKCKTSDFGRVWAKINEIYRNAHNKRIFDSDGFNFANISGCRSTYMKFYYPIKIAEHKELIKYEKRGFITRLKKNLNIQTEFV